MFKKSVFVCLFAIATGLCANPIVITSLYDSTGNNAIFASSAIKGAKLAIKMINQKGGVLGNKLRLNTESDAQNAYSFQSLNQTMTGKNSSDFVLTFANQLTPDSAAVKLAKTGKVVITAGSTPMRLVRQNIFPSSFNDKVQAAAAAQYIMAQMHLARVFVLYQPSMVGSDELRQNFALSFRHLKGKLVGGVSLATGKITPEIMDQINSSHPNVLYIVADNKMTPKLIKQLRDSDNSLPIMLTSSADASQISELGKATADNIYFTTEGYYDNNFMDDNMEAFVKAYTAEYKQKPDNIFSAIGYDNVQLLAAAMKKAKSSSAAKVATALKRLTNFKGVTADLDMSQNPPSSIVTVVKILNAKSRIAAMVIPQYIPPV